MATRKYAKEDRAKSWLLTISTLVILIALLFGTVFNFHISLRIACSILAGLVIVRMFVIYHDYEHHTILQKSKLAEIIFTIFGAYVLAPTSIWKRSHDYHHVNNSKLFSASIGSYPIYTKEKFRKSPKSERAMYLFIRHPLTITFGYIFAFLYGMCIKSIINSFKKHIDSLIALIFHFAYQIVVFYFLGWQTWVLLCAIPHFISGAMGAYLFYAQHNFPGVTFKGNIEWSYDNAALESSSYMDLNPFMHWVTANIGYHHIHHLNARIPFYRLPEVMRDFPELQTPKKTSLKPWDIAACFRLKVWDPEQNRMVGV
ncbi:MAG: fatty acid desaturase [Bacteroidetes bacterium]|nr:fatty acid desaturase [Bacteroidota bacterium]